MEQRRWNRLGVVGWLRRWIRAGGGLRLRLRTALKGRTIMIFDYSLAALVSLGLLFYLTYALLRPERF